MVGRPAEDVPAVVGGLGCSDGCESLAAQTGGEMGALFCCDQEVSSGIDVREDLGRRRRRRRDKASLQELLVMLLNHVMVM